LKITGIEVAALRYPYPAGGGFQFAGGYCDARLSCLIEVSTDSGITGTGSVYSHPELVRWIVEGQLQDLFVGEDPIDVERLWRMGYDVTRWYGRKGVAVSALGGVDTALWDIRGKIAGKPVYQLLGAQRDSVAAYASALLWYDDPSDLAREAKDHLARGFRGMKTRLGRNYEYDVAASGLLRRTIGPECRLMIEGNARYDLAQARRMAEIYRACNAFWFEEPFVPEDVDSYRALHADSGVPLAAGENEFGVQGFRELIEGGYIDIVQPDCSRAGGLTECRRIGMLATEHGLPVATHTWSDAVALVANMHLIASLPTGLTVEIDRTGNALIDELLSEPLRVIEGEVALPQEPGLGIELNQRTVDQYRVAPGAIPPGIYSDMIFGPGNYTPAPSYGRMPAAVS
jgi:L-alanine-DL-glutamate epimerase-like enolase superfamily enzyme